MLKHLYWIAAIAAYWMTIEAYVIWPHLFYPGLAILAVLVVSVTLMIAPRPYNLEQTFNYLILPLTLSMSAAIYSTLLSSRSGVQFVSLLTTGFLFFYYSNVYRSWRFPEKYKLENLEAVYSLGSWLAMFFGASAVYGLQYFLSLPNWLPTIVLLAIVMLLTYKSLWIRGFDIRHNLVFVFLLPFIVVQVGWSLYFLPFSYNVLGLILAMTYFLSVTLIKLHLGHRLDRRSLRRYLFFIAILLTLVLLTAKWR